MANTTQQDENALVERVFLRIGSAETDEQLQTAVGKFLAPLLLKLNSSDESVRAKVMKLLAHIKTRLKSRSQVKLPLDALLTQFQDPKATPFIVNFTIVFIQLGFPRIEGEKQAELVPLLINCIEGRSLNHQDSLLQLIIPALSHIHLPKSEEECRAKFPLRDRPAVKQLLLDYFMDIMLLPYNSHVSAIQSSGPDGSAYVQPPTLPVPPGLSESAMKRLTSKNPLSPEALEKAKLSILKFLGSGVVDETDVVCLYVIASSDTRHSVATSADLELKRITGSVDWNAKDILTKLFSIFQGTVVLKGQRTVKPEDRRNPAPTRIRLKLFPIFLKAREACNMFPSCLQVVFDCLFGVNPNPKLRLMAVQFVHFICISCEDAKFAMFDVVFLNGMSKVIQESKEDDKLRSLAYIAVGKIGRRSPHRLAKDIQVVQTFFNAICQEDGDTRLAVQEALSMMSSAFQQLDQTNKQLMEALLLQNIDKEEVQARVVCVQYAATVFPSNHIPSRYILMLGAGDIKEDVRSESVKNLRGLQAQRTFGKPSEPTALPNFVEMVNYITIKARQRRESNHRSVFGNTVLPFNPASYTEVVLYLRMCLSQSAGQPVERETESLQQQVPAIAKVVRDLLEADQTENGPIHLYVKMLQELLTVTPSEDAMYCLLEVVAMVPDVLAVRFDAHRQWMMSLLSNSKEKVKDCGSQLLAIVFFHSGRRQQFLKQLTDLEAMMGQKLAQYTEASLGALLSLGYLIGLKQRSDRECTDVEMNTPQIEKENEELTGAVEKIVALLDDSKTTTRAMACIALGEIGRSAALPIPDGEDESEAEKSDEPGVDTMSAKKEDKKPEEKCTKLALVKKLLAMVKTSNEINKTKERAALCLGDICSGQPQFPHRFMVMKELFNVIQSKQVDLQMTIGEALVCVALGVKSPRARWVWTTTKEQHQLDTRQRPDEVAWLLEQILSKYIRHQNPHLRQGACIWLLTLVKQAGDHPAIQEKLLETQRGFMRLLTENDDVTQDFASKGLGLMMEVCSKEQKDSLVSELVETLMTGKSAKNVVGADTAVFDSGALGKTPDGSGMSTYKELCSIATDLNQPDLIYKFMHLANHNASWNARKGAAFGFSTIAAQAGEQLAPYLTQIVPRLYRYQFDPNPKIQQAMSGIWSALVQDNKKTVDTYLKEILNDLLKNLTSNQWRVRESSCLAVSDLLRGRVLDEIVDDIPQLWEVCLRVRDDIKESVRLAADAACKTLSRVSVKICDINNGKVGEKATKLVLPCLLQCSLQSSVSEVRAIGLSTILQISRNAGALLKPSIPVLVVALLEAVSGLEPQVINYLSLHTGSQANQEKLDSARIAASKMSPMMETVNRCVQYVDETVLPELVPRLIELIRGGIGVSTKVGCSSFVVSLIHQCPQDLGPYAGKLMAAFLHGLSDRNASIRKAYATALGHLVRVGKDSSVEKLIQRLKSWYLENEEGNSRHACCACLHAMSRHSPDCLSRHANEAMPLAFFAMHQEKKKEEGEEGGGRRKLEETTEWEDVWNEVTPGTEAGIKLYLPELVELTSSCLDSQVWSVKAQAGRSIATIADKLGPHLYSPHLDKLLAIVIAGLSGRTWAGKESLLKALSTICISCRESILNGKQQSEDLNIEKISALILRECGKEQPAYKMAAFNCLGPILELYRLDQFQAIWDLTKPLVNASSSPRSEDDDDASLSQKQEMSKAAFTLLGQAWPFTSETQDRMLPDLTNLLCRSMSTTTWKVQVVLLKNMQTVVERSHAFSAEGIQRDSSGVEELVKSMLTASMLNLESVKYVSLRTESVAVIEKILLKLKELDHSHLIPENRITELKEALSPLAESGPWELRDKAKDLVLMVGGFPDRGDNCTQAMEH